MHAALKVISPPASPVFDTPTLAQHLRLDGDADALLLPIYRDAATAMVEKHLGRALVTQTLRWTVGGVNRQPSWASAIAPATLAPISYADVARRLSAGIVELPYGPVQAVTAVAIGEWGEADTALAAGDDYAVDLATDPARLRLDPAYSWGTYNHLSIDYTAGYGGMGSVPAPIVAAVLLTAAGLYEHRGDDGAGPGLSPAAKALLAPYRVAWFA